MEDEVSETTRMLISEIMKSGDKDRLRELLDTTEFDRTLKEDRPDINKIKENIDMLIDMYKHDEPFLSEENNKVSEAWKELSHRSTSPVVNILLIFILYRIALSIIGY